MFCLLLCRCAAGVVQFMTVPVCHWAAWVTVIGWAQLGAFHFVLGVVLLVAAPLHFSCHAAKA